MGVSTWLPRGMWNQEGNRGVPLGVTAARRMVGLLALRLPPPKQMLAHDVLANKDMFGDVGRS